MPKLRIPLSPDVDIINIGYSDFRNFVTKYRELLIVFLNRVEITELFHEGTQQFINGIDMIINNTAEPRNVDDVYVYEDLKMLIQHNLEFINNLCTRMSSRLQGVPASSFIIPGKKRSNVDMITLNPISSEQAFVTLDNGKPHAYTEIKNFEQSSKIKTPYNYTYTPEDRRKINELINYIGGKKRNRKSKKMRKTRKSKKSRKYGR